MPGDPESLSSSLAHVVASREGEDVILGQAWLAGPGKLVTCGHVVEEHKRNPAGVTVKFPLSGNRYVVREVRMHPTYGQKGKEQLIRFDLAVLHVDLMEADAHAPLLPITYDKYEAIPAQQALTAIRYPSHLGQLTTSQFPLAQVGRYLGLLKKTDRFHLLHDLALAPGDSGSPIFDGDSVIAVHCGDTATLPGLNLPTTSIRLAVSIEALRALEIAETKPLNNPNPLYAVGPGLLAFVITALISFSAVAYLLLAPSFKSWMLENSSLGRMTISFNEALDKYRELQVVEIDISPERHCFLKIYYTEDNKALILYPPPGSESVSELNAGTLRKLDGFGKYKLKANSKPGGKIHVLVLKNDRPIVEKKEMKQVDSEVCELPITADELEKRILTAVEDKDNECILQVFDAPEASLPAAKKNPDGDTVDESPAEEEFAQKENTDEVDSSVDTTEESKPDAEALGSGSSTESGAGAGSESGAEQTLEEVGSRRDHIIEKLTEPKQKESREMDAIRAGNSGSMSGQEPGQTAEPHSKDAADNGDTGNSF